MEPANSTFPKLFGCVCKYTAVTPRQMGLWSTSISRVRHALEMLAPLSVFVFLLPTTLLAQQSTHITTDPFSGTFAGTSFQAMSGTPGDEVDVVFNEAGTTVSSVANTQGDAALVMSFTLQDEGSDASNVLLEEITIRKSGNDDFGDWTDIMEGAALVDSDGRSDYTGVDIFADRITFSGFDQATNRTGGIADGESKQYELYIWLKETVAGNLNETMDGNHLVFELTPNIDIETAAGSSGIRTTGTIGTADTDNEVVVTATALAVTTQPSAEANAFFQFDTPATVQAVDANGNWSRRFTSTGFQVTNTADFTQRNTPDHNNLSNGSLTTTELGFISSGSTRIVFTDAATGYTVQTNEITINPTVGLSSPSNGLNSGTLQNATQNQAIIGVGLTYFGSFSFTDLVFQINEDPTGKIENIRLVSSGTSSVYNPATHATNVVAADPVYNAGELRFEAISGQGFTGASVTQTYHYFLIADVAGTVNENDTAPLVISYNIDGPGFTNNAYVVDGVDLGESFESGDRTYTFESVFVTPSVATGTPGSISLTSANVGGNVSADGGANVTEYGIVWGTNPGPDITDNKFVIGSGTGSFSDELSGLSSGVTYYVRAYATNAVGTAYGAERSFTTNVQVSSIQRHDPTGATTNSDEVVFQVNYTGPVNGLGTSNFALDSSGVSGASITGISGSGDAYEVTANTGTGDGTLRLDFANNTDVSPNVEAVPFTGGQTYTIDRTPPVATISTSETSPTMVTPIPVDIEFSKDVVGLTSGDVSVSGGSAGTISGNGSSYSVDITPAGDGTITVNIPADAAQDLAGNSSLASNELTITYITGYVVTPNAVGGGSLQPDTIQAVFPGDTISFDLIPDTGHRIDSVTGCGGTLSGNTFTTGAVNADCTVEALFSPNTLTIDLTDSDGESPGTRPIASHETLQVLLAGGTGPFGFRGEVTRAGQAEDLDEVSTGSVVLEDPEDGSAVLTRASGDEYTFVAQRPGLYVIEVTDSTFAMETFEIEISPQVAFTSVRQYGSDGEQIEIRAVLEGIPASYPVRVPYEVSGSMLLDDFGILGGGNLDTWNGELEFDGGTHERLLRLRATPNTNGGDIRITLRAPDDSDGTILGSPLEHVIQLHHVENTPLPAGLEVMQGGDTITVAETGEGTVTLTASPDSLGAGQYDWSHSVTALGLASEVEHQVTLDPAVVGTGRHYVRVDITDGPRTNTVERVLRITDNIPGGYADLLTEQANTGSHRIVICREGAFRAVGVDACEPAAEDVWLTTAEGYRLQLGSTAERVSWNEGRFGTGIQLDDLQSSSGLEALNREDPGYDHLGYLIDFEITGIQSPGSALPVVVPLPDGETIPDDAVWRKWHGSAGWRTFAEDEANRLYSAERQGETCPWPGSDRWKPGLNPEHSCVRLIIEDGGPNDVDGRADGVIRDPGTLAAPRVEARESVTVRSGTGSMGPGILVLLLLAGMMRWRASRRGGVR